MDMAGSQRLQRSQANPTGKPFPQLNRPDNQNGPNTPTKKSYADRS